jgi:hypothetical protein
MMAPPPIGGWQKEIDGIKKRDDETMVKGSEYLYRRIVT